MKTILLLSILGLLSACSSITGNNNAVIEDKSIDGGGTISAIERDGPQANWSNVEVDATKTPEEVSATKKAVVKLKADKVPFVFYFPYDEAEIDIPTTQEIIKHANFMREHSNIKLRLEGHADERGTREYNLALGENRALSIKEVLSLYEGLNTRIEVVSYGEEKPISEGHDEDAWQQNRRVEFIYK